MIVGAVLVAAREPAEEIDMDGQDGQGVKIKTDVRLEISFILSILPTHVGIVFDERRTGKSTAATVL